MIGEIRRDMSVSFLDFPGEFYFIRLERVKNSAEIITNNRIYILILAKVLFSCHNFRIRKSVRGSN